MITTVQEFMYEIGRSFRKAGIVPFFQQDYAGKEIERLTPFDVGVIAGYLPHKAALFSCIVRFHPEGPDALQYVHIHVSSQHRKGVKIQPIFSDRIRRGTDEKSWDGISYHQLPILSLDGFYNNWLHHMGQSIDDADFPVEEKVAYVYDIFGQFVELYGGTLLERFTDTPRFEVAPYWSKEYEQVAERLGDRRHEPEKYFFLQMLGEIPDYLIEEDRSFPLPPVGVGKKDHEEVTTNVQR